MPRCGDCGAAIPGGTHRAGCPRVVVQVEESLWERVVIALDRENNQSPKQRVKYIRWVAGLAERKRGGR